MVLAFYRARELVDFGKVSPIMLQTMRHMAHSWLFKGLMVVLVVSFGIWGIGDMFRGNPQTRVVAKVGNVDITMQQLGRMFDQLLSQARRSFGPDFTAAQARQFGLMNAALDRLIEGSVLDQDVARLGIDVDDRTVLESLKDKPQFHNKDGVFDPALLRQALSQANMSEKAFLNLERQGVGRRMLAEAFLDDAALSQTALDLVYRAKAQRRAFDVVSLEHSGYEAGNVPDDNSLREFHKSHEKTFSAPEYRAITIASLSLADVAKDVTVTEDQIREEYDQRGEQLVKPERRDILQVVLQDAEKAKKLSEDATKRKDLAAAAKTAGLEAVPLKQIESKSVLPELSQAVFALGLKDISPPVKSSLGWHVAQITAITPAGKPTFDEIKDGLRESMKRDQAIESSTRIVNKLDDELAAGHSLEDIADTLRLRLIRIPAVDIGGLAPDGKAPAELPYKEDVLRAAYGQNASETSPVMDDKNGNSYVVRTDEVTPSGLKPFENVRNEVVAAWMRQEQEKMAIDNATKIAGELRAGKELLALGSHKSMSVRVTEPLSMLEDSHDPMISTQSLATIFSIKKGDAKVVSEKDRQLVVRLNRVVDVQDSDSGVALAKNKVTRAMREDVPNEIGQQYTSYLRTSVFPVRVNRGAIESAEQRGE